jgi:hypothetical protein
MQQAGTIGNNEAFKNILSIGFEFESNDLAKLSLTDDGDNVLINSSMNLTILREKEFNEFATRRDEYYDIVEEDEEDDTALYYSEYLTEYDKKKSGEENEDVVFHVTNDIGHIPFSVLLSQKCNANKHRKNEDEEDAEIPGDDDRDKNELYVYVDSDKNEYPIHFDKIMRKEKPCSSFSCVEWVMTYYDPQQSTNIILETFLNASKHIIDHLKTAERINGQLYYITENGHKSQIGHLDSRVLYHKPGTNLYYLQTHDGIWNNKPYNIGMISMLPQMTFRAHIMNIVDVMKQILALDELDSNKSNRKIIQEEFNSLENINLCVKELIESYNSKCASSKDTVKWCIPGSDSKMGQILHGYFFMIFYKLHMFVDYYAKTDMDSEGNYFKDYIAFSSRHSNYIFYDRIKSILIKRFYYSPSTALSTSPASPKISHSPASHRSKGGGANSSIARHPSENKMAVNVVLNIVNQPDILARYMYRRNKKALKSNLNKGDENYGNPDKSYLSYWKHFENPSDPDTESVMDEIEPMYDWLKIKIDKYSTQYDLRDDDTILVENRFFFTELAHFAQSTLGIKMKGSITLNQMKRFYNIMIRNRTVQPLDGKEINPNTGRLVNKCKIGQYRNENFRCVKDPALVRPTRSKTAKVPTAKGGRTTRRFRGHRR